MRLMICPVMQPSNDKMRIRTLVSSQNLNFYLLHYEAPCENHVSLYEIPRKWPRHSHQEGGPDPLDEGTAICYAPRSGPVYCSNKQG